MEPEELEILHGLISGDLLWFLSSMSIHIVLQPHNDESDRNLERV